MTAAWRKVVSDLWRGRTRAALVVLAIAIGLAGFFAVMSTYAILKRELDRGYRATNPASVVITMAGPIDDALLAQVAALPGVADVDARRTLKGRFRTGEGKWRHLTLFVLRDPLQLSISTATPEAGTWPPPPGGLAIERDAFQVAKVAIGDVVTIELGGRERTLTVAARLHDAGQAQARMENAVYGYVTRETLAALGEAPDLDRLYVLAGGDRMSEAHVQEVANGVAAWLKANGHAVRKASVPPPGQHPHAAIMGLLLLSMAAFGLLALALSGVIVVNLLLARMATERRAIGVMKALGATRGQIARIYLAEAGLLGALAVALATPAGLLFGRVLCFQFAALLNFDLQSLAVPLWVYLLVAVFGLFVPLLAAAVPVATGTAVTVRAALADSGGDPAAFGARRIDRLLARLGGAGRPLLLGVRNAARRPLRTALTLLTLAVAGAFFVSALSFRDATRATVDRLAASGAFGHVDPYAIDQHMLMIYVFLLIMAGVLGAVGGLGLATATSLNVLDRRRETGVLRAIGAGPQTVAAIVVLEAVTVALAAAVVALLAAWPITAALGQLVVSALRVRGFTVVLSPLAIVLWLALSTALAAAASLLPALSASRRSIHEEISHE